VALSDDQKAILRLLSQRGAQGYEDLSALLGVSVDEIHSRAKAAAAQLESEGIPAPTVPEPSGEPSPPPVPAEKPAPAEKPVPAEKPQPEPQAHLAEEKPAAPQVQTPAPPPPAAASPKSPSRPTAAKPKLALPSDRGARIGFLAGAAVLVLLIILLVTGVLGGGDDSGTTTSSNTPAQEAAGSEQLTQAVLEPVDDGDASGRALFGRAGKNVLLQVEAEGLEPSPQGQSYVVWLARSPQQMLPLAASKVEQSGKIAARYQVPTEVLAFLASGSFDEIAITQIGDTAFRNSVAQARKEKKSPAYTGTAVLRGQITGPIVGLAKKEG
jgi:hypothetical protein